MEVVLDGKPVNIDSAEGKITITDALTIADKRQVKDALFAIINGQNKDMSHILNDGDTVKIISKGDEKGLEVLRHTTAHIMAQAVQRLFTGAKVTIGPVIEGGFYYDFHYHTPFNENDLKTIEKEMKKIIAQNFTIEHHTLTAEQAITKFSGMEEPYKVEIIESLGEDTVTIYTQGEFEDLCRGVHLPSTAKVQHFKLLSVAGAYWRGDENNEMLQRIYGTAFFTKDELNDHLNFLEEAKRRDHRVLNKDLELFMFDDDIGAGLPIYLPNGARMLHALEEFSRKDSLQRSYLPVRGPILMKQDVWKVSGHYDNYRENMYFTEIEGAEFGIKPMNCVGHVKIYASELRSYRELPIRYSEFGTVHRHERSGALHGLLRVRGFTQDDAHIFCTPTQLHNEIVAILEAIQYQMGVFGFEYTIKIATKPTKAMGKDEDWNWAIAELGKGCDSLGLPYDILEGEGAFYGPKIEVHIKDSLSRTWQVGTVQIDFNLPERFDLKFIDQDGNAKMPVMIHRAIFGSLERFMGVLIEHYAGRFPLWLAPTQIVVMNITQDSEKYVENITTKLLAEGLRVESDTRNEKIGYKIRAAQVRRVPHMIVVGNDELNNNTLALRLRDGTNINTTLEEYIQKITDLSDNKSSELWR